MANPVLTEDAVTVTVETPRETDYAALEEPNSTTAATAMMLDKPNAAEVVPTTPGAPARVQPKFSLYVCCFLGVLCSFQYGWATSQLNFALFNKKADCDRRPVKEGTCIMFPGHTKTEWTIVVNAWIVGGMFGALSIGTIADKIGRMRALQVIAVHIIVSAVLMASAYNLWQFAVGRLIAGLASGAMTGNLGSYINEVAPPHLRSNLGVIVQGGITVGILCVATTFFYLDFFDGWRIIAAFPVVLGGGFLIMSQLFMVESPVWLLLKGRREEAEKVIEHLYGKENIPAALEWMGAKPKHRPSAGPHHHEKSMAYGDLLKPDLRRQFIVAICLATMQKLTGINTVFYYSSDLFSQAGLKNARVATIIVDIVSMVPTCTSGLFSTKFGARSMLLWGISAMGVSFALLTIALVYDIGWLVILSMSTYVASFGCSLGPLLWVVTAAIFPDYARAKVSSIGVMVAWLANLVVGVGYPYLSTSLKAYAYLPFIAVIVASVLFVFYFIPETSGKTTEQIQEEFRKMRKAPAMVQAVEATPEES